MLADNPNDAWIWDRLGDVYLKGERPDLAAVAYEQSTLVNLGQVESHFSLGIILSQIGQKHEAVGHLRNMLLRAGNYEHMDADSLRDMLTNGLHTLVEISDGPEQFMSYLPLGPDFAAAGIVPGHESGLLEFVDIEIDTRSFEGMYPIAEIY